MCNDGSAATDAGEVLEALVGPAAEHLDEEVVHRLEVVVDELGLEPGLRADPPRRDRGVAVLEQQPLGGVEEPGPGLRVGGAEATG